MTNQPQNEQPQEHPEKKRQRKGRARSKGEGSVFRRTDSTRKKPWVAQVTIDGKTKPIGYFKTEAEALAAKNKALRELEQATWVAHSSQTLAEYMNYWLEHVHKGTIALSTYQDYRGMIDLHIIPALGRIHVQKLTMRQVQMFCSSLQEKLSPGRVRNIHALLHSAIDHAVKEGLVARNVSEDVRLPHEEEKERVVLNVEQADQLLKVASVPWLKVALTVAVTTGMRRGEIVALKWSDLDLANRYLQVRRNLIELRGRGLYEKGPKTTHSRRKITLPFFVVEMLKEHKANQEEIRRAAGNDWIERDLIFCTENGDYIKPHRLSRAFKRLLKQANLPSMRLHDLRHSAFTILLAMGVPAKVVQEIAGHSHISTTLGTYGHVIPGMHEDAMSIWDNELGGQAGTQREDFQAQWNSYSPASQAWLEILLKRYGKDAVKLALNAIRDL
jgi:integrase